MENCVQMCLDQAAPLTPWDRRQRLQNYRACADAPDEDLAVADHAIDRLGQGAVVLFEVTGDGVVARLGKAFFLFVPPKTSTNNTLQTIFYK